MSTLTELRAALGPVTAAVVDDFGTTCRLKRRDDPTYAADGSERANWYTPNGTTLGVPVYLYNAGEDKRQREWGSEIRVAVDGLAKRNPIREGDRLKPKSGEYQDRVFEVQGRHPDDVGGIALLALVEVPLSDTDTGGF